MNDLNSKIVSIHGDIQLLVSDENLQTLNHGLNLVTDLYDAEIKQLQAELEVAKAEGIREFISTRLKLPKRTKTNSYVRGYYDGIGDMVNTAEDYAKKLEAKP